LREFKRFHGDIANLGLLLLLAFLFQIQALPQAS
jgi:hypothetical protein